MMPRKPISRSPNPYANPLGRQTPAQRMQHKPDIMATAHAERKEQKLKTTIQGARDLGPALYDITLSETGLPVLVSARKYKG